MLECVLSLMEWEKKSDEEEKEKRDNQTIASWIQNQTHCVCRRILDSRFFISGYHLWNCQGGCREREKTQRSRYLTPNDLSRQSILKSQAEGEG
jgi:hypothetical protein